MVVALSILGVVVAYIGIATVLTPRFYRQLRDTVPNTYSSDPPGQTARNLAYTFAWLWPLGLFLFGARVALRRVDERAEFDKQERAELARFRAEALRELGGDNP